MGDPPKKVYLPGWNDPPMLSYSTTNPPPKSRITNKRVAFPVETSTTQCTSQLPEFSRMPAHPTGNPCIEVLYFKACENFTKSLELLDDEGIKEQIWQLLSSWQNGNFSEKIQKLLTNLSTNVVEGNQTAASQDYLKLAMIPDEPLIKTYLQYLKSLAYLSGKS